MYCGSVDNPKIMSPVILLSFCVYRSPYNKFVLCRLFVSSITLFFVAGSVSHIYLADICYRGMTFYKACPSDIGRCIYRISLLE